jgi:DNA-binding response OmpR family regulator
MYCDMLVVEDEFINAHFLCEVLKQLGHRIVASVASAKEAIEIVESGVSIDMVFMDINLDGNIDGLACARQMNEIEPIAIIYTTAYQDDQTTQEATQTNIYGYLMKPFDFVDVKMAVKIATKQLAKERALEREEVRGRGYICGFYRFDEVTNTVFEEERSIHLTKNELKLFITLYEGLNHHVSNAYIGYALWGDEEASLEIIRNTMARLRKKLPKLQIETITGFGYMLREGL